MTDNLVIVESPAKARTIERYLDDVAPTGDDAWQVVASYGHIRDLPKSDFAVEADRSGCHLTYEVPAGARDHVRKLRRAAGDAEVVWLAPDLDREGEAIAWHIADELALDPESTNRVTFDEITKDAIQQAFQQPRGLNDDLVDAQQARRAVDRIVGYRLSPVLWRTVASGISAGRVQSVALRLIVDREDEIRAFEPQEYWDFDALLARGDDDEPTVEGYLHSVGGRRITTPKDIESKQGDAEALAGVLLVGDGEQAEDLRDRALAIDAYTVDRVDRSERRRSPKAPFTTSTLQQEAANRLGFSARKTMTLAQQLYEGVDLGEEGSTGLITYMRTDSVNLSDTALAELSDLVAERYGSDYTLDEPRTSETSQKGAQEAHEAIRPTSALRLPGDVAGALDRDQRRLYELIWTRTVATQMAPAVFDRLSVDVVGTDASGDDEVDFSIRVSGQVLTFDGYLRVYHERRDDGDEDDEPEVEELPDLEEGQLLDLRELSAEQHFTSPPPRYSEATLVRTLEDEGIGRPSTYASIISTIRSRDYVEMRSKRFHPTPLGEVVTSFLKAHFAEVVDVGFTARMEQTLDQIASGREAWCSTVRRFLDEVDTWVEERKPERPRLPLSEPAECPECGAEMEKVFSGKSKQWFASCSRWPECEGTLPLNADGTVGEPEPELEPDDNVACPKCGTSMVLRDGRYGEFYGCPRYPDCDGIRNISSRCVYRTDDGDIEPFISPTDGESYLERRRSRYGKEFVGSTGYPEDRFAVWSVPVASPCPECGAPVRQPPKSRNDPIGACANPEVEHLWELPGWDQPEIGTIEVVPGVEAYDPDLGGEPLAEGPVPAPLPMEAAGSREPRSTKDKGDG